MADQILRVRDESAVEYDLGVTAPNGDVAIRNYDPNVHDTLEKKFGAPQGSAVAITTSGDHDVVTPTSTKSLRLKWVGISAPETNSAEVIVTVKLGTSVLYMWALGPSCGFAHGSVREGGVDEPLTVNLSSGQTVYFNYEFEEF